MPFASAKQKNKVCGNCAHINEPASNLPLLVNICREIASNGVTIIMLTQLAQHVRHVTGLKRWCPKEGWTHLLDQACYAWKPRENEVKNPSTYVKCSDRKPIICKDMNKQLVRLFVPQKQKPL